MKKTITIMLVVICLLLSLTLTACDEQTEGTLRISEVTHSIFYAPQYIAMELGYFEEEGITIELNNAGGADNVMTALLANEADIGLMGCEASMYVYLEEMENYPKIIAQLTKRDGSFLVAREADPSFNWTGMDDKTVLMGRTGGMPAMILQSVLNEHDYINGDNIVMDYSIQFGVLSQAFAGGTGNYVPLFEPVASQLAKEGKGHIVASIGEVSGEVPYTCYTANNNLLEDNPKIIEGFLRAVWRGTEYVLNHTPEEVAKLLVNYFETDLDIIKSAVGNYKKYDAWMATPVTSTTAWENVQDIMENANELEERVPYEDLVNTEIATRVYKQLH